MSQETPVPAAADVDPLETREWIEALEEVLKHQGPQRLQFLLKTLHDKAASSGIDIRGCANTPYINTIPPNREPPYPGDRRLERRIKSIIRWNAMAMVVRANREEAGIGGHISTYASAATLIEVGFNHFFRGSDGGSSGDQVYFQGHASPGIYARAFLEGRLTEEQLHDFRRELRNPGRGLPSYPHPWLMSGFWEFPTVSMGLSPLMGIYQARFNQYLKDRGLLDTSNSRVWVFVGDGEADEPEALGAITLAGRERLDNLIFVVNCNLQRLDGPVRGNGKIIQELEAIFHGAGWNVIKVIWGSDLDPLLAADEDGLLVERMNQTVDGEYQKYSVESGDYIRRNFFGVHPRLLALVEHLGDDQIKALRRGGHDPSKVVAAYRAAVEHRGSPTVILAKTIKGYGLGESGEGRNVTHQQKKLSEEELLLFRDRFDIPIKDDDVAGAPFYKPPQDSPEIQYLLRRREELGGFIPARRVQAPPVKTPGLDFFEEFLSGSRGREVATTMAFVRMLSLLLGDMEIGRRIVPIVPDEARTFGMDALFRQCGIYSHVGQLYEPVDSHTLLHYREATDGQILEEGITEAGSMASFIAAGSSYATHGICTIPFFIFYSMFGFQRIGDLIWAAADMRCKGFLLGGTSGRTTLSGEGLQHQDGHSHLLAVPVPNLLAYDPAYAYELAVIIQDGLKRMAHDREDVFYYITLGNEPYAMPQMPRGVEEGIRRGLYKLKAGERKAGRPRVQLLGSGTILREVLRARQILAERFAVNADVWSATSFKELRRDALEAERHNRLHPAEQARLPYINQMLDHEEGPVIAATDYIKAVPDLVAPFLRGRLHSLGTDGFGRSDSRAALRSFFEVDAESIAVAALYALSREGKIASQQVAKAITELGIDPDKPDPAGA